MATEQTLPLFGETAAFGTRKVVTGRTRVCIAPATEDQVVPVSLTDQSVSVERVPIGRIIETVPRTRVEGDTTIIPVVEERAEVTIRLYLREEVHVRPVRTTRAVTRTVSLRHETVAVGREDITPGDEGAINQGEQT